MARQVEGVLLKNEQQSVAAEQTDQVISKEFPIKAGDRLLIEMLVSAATVSAGITAKLQTSTIEASDGTRYWNDSKTVSITGVTDPDETFQITLNPEVSGDQGFLPLGAFGRVVMSTGTGDSVTVDQIRTVEQAPV